MDQNEVTFTVPLSISVRLGQPGNAGFAEAAVITAPVSPDLEAARTPSYYDGYQSRGYDKEFLGETVRLPELSGEQRRNAAKNSHAREGDDPILLPYTHFSVVMNRRRQLAYYTAVNIDGLQSSDLNRGRDRWFFDARIAESEQIGETLYARNKLDRGHLVRRLDPVWGTNAERANDDTFHFTNCSPQHERFNQGQDLWQGLENFYLNRATARDKKFTVFTGPVMDDTDPIYKGVRLPLAFYKIIVYVRDGRLRTAAYILDQAGLIAQDFGLEAAFEPGLFRVKIEELIQRTGLDFNYLIDFELPLSDNTLESGMSRVPVASDFRNVSM